MGPLGAFGQINVPGVDTAHLFSLAPRAMARRLDQTIADFAKVWCWHACNHGPIDLARLFVTDGGGQVAGHGAGAC